MKLPYDPAVSLLAYTEEKWKHMSTQKLVHQYLFTIPITAERYKQLKCPTFEWEDKRCTAGWWNTTTESKGVLVYTTTQMNLEASCSVESACHKNQHVTWLCFYEMSRIGESIDQK